MLTKEEFAKGCRVYQRQIVIAVLVLTVAWGSLTTMLVMYFENWLRSHADPFLFGFILFACLALYVMTVFVASKIIAKRRCVMCPSCGNFMGELQLMLKTNNCRRCRSVIYIET